MQDRRARASSRAPRNHRFVVGRAIASTMAGLVLTGLALAPALPAAAAAPTAPSAPPPAAAFGALPAIDDVTLSPDGRSLAYSIDQGAKGKVVVAVDLASGDTRSTFPLGAKGKLRDLEWADDETLLIEVSLSHEWYGRGSEMVRQEMFRTIAVDLKGGKPQMLLMQGGSRNLVSGAYLVSTYTDQPKTVLMSTMDFSFTKQNSVVDTRIDKGRHDTGWVHKIYAVNVRTGAGKQLEIGTAFTTEWLADAAGRPVARGEWEPEAKLYRILAKRGMGWNEIYRQNDGGTLSLEAISADGAAVIARGYAGAQHEKLWSIAMDGSGARVFLEDPNYDVESVLRDRFDGRPIGATIGGPDGTTRWLDPKAEAMQQRIARAFPGRTVHVYGRSRDEQRVLAEVTGTSAPPVYYVVDLAKRTADIVGEAYPGLADAKLGTVQSITYPARDGTPIPAYLTLPPGDAKTNLALVVLPHGGPEARDELRFDWLVQYLATRGYAVLQPQFRGSTGFGEAWRKAGYRQWGGLMQDDVSDGVAAMVKQGVADAKRVCIVGASYGGYAALAGATLTPELYRCAVSIGGVSDLTAMLGFTKMNRGDESNSLAYWNDHIGSVHDPKVLDRSPVRHADAVRAPILLVHGTKDTVVPIEQSEFMAGELKRAGKPFEFIRLEDEDHWLSRGETRTRVLEETGRFLEQNLR